MSIIRNLAKICVANIKHDQNDKTAVDRKIALSQIQDAINTNQTDLVAKISTIADYVRHHGYFGWYGPEGSTFLKHTETFLKQAKFMQKLAAKEEQLSPSGVRELGLYTAHAIALTQNKFTASEELIAKNDFLTALKDKEQDDAAFIFLARHLCDTIPKHSSIWSFGSYENYFLTLMKDFIAQAEQLSQLHINDVKEDLKNIVKEKISLKNPSTFFNISEFNFKLLELEKMEQRRQMLEKNIQALIQENYPQHMMAKDWENKALVLKSDDAFLSSYAKEIAAVPALNHSMKDYLAIMQNEKYQQKQIETPPSTPRI